MLNEIDSALVAQSFALAVVLSAVTGFRVILGLLGIAVLSKLGIVHLPSEFQFLSSTIVLWLIGTAALVEAASDLSDTFALMFDSIAAPLRSSVGSLVGMGAVAGMVFQNQELSGFARLLTQPETLTLLVGSGIIGGGTSYASSTGKKWSRRAVSTLVPFFGGKVASSAETIGAGGILVIACANPWIAFGIVVLAATGITIFLYLFYKTARFALNKAKAGIVAVQERTAALQGKQEKDELLPASNSLVE